MPIICTFSEQAIDQPFGAVGLVIASIPRLDESSENSILAARERHGHARRRRTCLLRSRAHAGMTNCQVITISGHSPYTAPDWAFPQLAPNIDHAKIKIAIEGMNSVGLQYGSSGPTGDLAFAETFRRQFFNLKPYQS
jgi:hypothetical protein